MSKDPTVDRLEDALRKAGVGGSWGGLGGHGPQPMPFAIRQAASLEKLKALLEQGLESKRAEIRSLNEKIQRLRHGGGS